MIVSSRSAITERHLPRGTAGFTLAEMAIALAIFGLLLGGMMVTLSSQAEQRNRSDTTRRLEEARELLIGFAVVNGRLPCPASTASNGSEANNGTTGQCTAAFSGFLPAKAIGFQPTDAAGFALDAWGNRIRYAVSINSSVAGAPDYNFTSSGTMKTNGITQTPSDVVICAASAADINTGATPPSCGATASNAVTNQNTVVAVIWSQGKNAATAAFSGVTGQSGADEALNNKTAANANHGLFVDHGAAPSSAANGEYDDQVIWIPVGLLYGRLISAGVLP